jgi:hypothetical protein
VSRLAGGFVLAKVSRRFFFLLAPRRDFQAGGNGFLRSLCRLGLTHALSKRVRKVDDIIRFGSAEPIETPHEDDVEMAQHHRAFRLSEVFNQHDFVVHRVNS